MSKPIENTPEYLRGMRECKEGKVHVSQGADYDRGFNVQYQHEENLSAGCFN